MKRIALYLGIFSLAATASGGECPPDFPNVPYGISNDLDHVVLQWDIFMPRGGFPAPVVLVIHSGGFRNGSRKDVRCPARDLADAGYIAVAIDYRLDHRQSFHSTQQIGCFSPEYAPLAQILDVKKAIQKARVPDPGTELFGKVNGQVAAIGGSSGGSHALWCAATDTGIDVSDKLNCAVLLSGNYDFDHVDSHRKYGEDSATFVEVVSLYCGTSTNDSEFHQHLQEGSPLNQVTADVAKLFIMASEFDSITPPQYNLLTGKIRELGSNGHKKRLLTDPENAAKHAFEYWSVVKDDAIRFLNETLSRQP